MSRQLNSFILFTLCAFLIGGCTLIRRITYNLPGYNDQLYFEYNQVNPPLTTSEFKVADDLSVLGQEIKIAPHAAALHLFSMEEYLNSSATLGFLILRNDSIIYESYLQGMTGESAMSSFSVAKTFVGALVGIAIGEGLIQDREDFVQQYIPEFPLADVRIRHLLDNTSGINYPPEGWLYYTPHLDRVVEKLQQRVPPGTDWRYENGNTQILGILLETITGLPLEEYLRIKIWDPLEMEGPLRWSADDNGLPRAFCCMNARARDFGRFGLLLLHDGQRNGEQIIPAGWISGSVNYSTTDGKFSRYSNQMWLENEVAGTFTAIGLYGQYIYIYPPKNIVIVRFARENPHLHAAWSEFFNTVIEQL